jgi:hypothetical protein
MVRGLWSDWARKLAMRLVGSEADAIVIRRAFSGVRGGPGVLCVESAGKTAYNAAAISRSFEAG